MKKFLKNYKSTLILLGSVILGVIVGLVFGEKATVLSPLGDIFINLMFVVIVPLVFLTISSAIIKMDSPKRLGKIMSRIVTVFILMSLVAALVGVVSTYAVKLVNGSDVVGILELIDDSASTDTELNILERTASILTVNDFNKLLSKDSIIAILIFAIIFGLGVRKTKEKGEIVSKFIIGLNDVILNVVNIIMYYAPIGLSCYMAALIGSYGSSIAVGFLKTFIVYTIASIFIYVVIYSIYALISGGFDALKRYWSVILAPTTMALATCSSAASIPVNVVATKKMGVSPDVCEATIPMGTSFHKDGSVLGSVFKIMFLVYLFNTSPSIWTVIGVSLLATLLVTAVPVGGGTISEMFILTLMGFPVGALPILTIIATVIDAPATVLNVVGDTSASLLIGRLVDGKKFLANKK